MLKSKRECLNCDGIFMKEEKCPHCGSEKFVSISDNGIQLMPAREYYINNEGEKKFRVSLNNYDNEWFVVYADYEQEALDLVVDFCESKNWTGHFIDREVYEVMDEDERDLCVIAGNHGWFLDSEHTHIEEVGADGY